VEVFVIFNISSTDIVEEDGGAGDPMLRVIPRGLSLEGGDRAEDDTAGQKQE
jgi:hypothetical protein